MSQVATAPGRMRATVQLGRRFLLMIGGEAMQSLFGFGLSIGMARALSARDFGVFSIVVLMAGIAWTYMRALVGVPAAMRIPTSHAPHRVAANVTTFGTASVGVGAGLGLATAAVLALWLRGDADVAAVTASGAAYVALWSVRGFVRGVALVERRVWVALAGDATFTAVGTLLVLLAATAGRITLVHVMLALGAACVCSIGLVLALPGRRVRLSLRRPTLRRYLVLWPGLGWSAADVTTTILQGQGQTALLALIAGPAAYAPIAAGLTLLAPLRLAAAALVSLIQPDLSVTIDRDPGRIGRILSRSTLMLAGLGVLYGAVLLALLPRLQHVLFADRFDADPMRPIVVLTLAISLTFLLYAAPRTLLELQGAFKRLTRIAALGAAFGLPAVTALLLWTDAAWSLAGLLLSELIVLAASWRAVRSDLRRSRWGLS